jgi:ketosteroid isomerase-like protein
MKRIVSVVVFVAAAAGMVFAQATDTRKPSGGTRPPTQDTEATLMKMERDAAAALVKRDLAGFGAIFADDATFTGPDGAVQTKAQLLADVKSGALAIQSTEISDLKVHVFGESAVATYATTDKGKYKDRDISGRYRWTDVFVRRGGKWQIVASQGTPIQ